MHHLPLPFLSPYRPPQVLLLQCDNCAPTTHRIESAPCSATLRREKRYNYHQEFHLRRETSHHPLLLTLPAAMAKASSIVPLIVLFLVVGFLAVVGFVVYSIANDVSQQTRQKLERKNVSFSRDGMKVGVKEVSVEQQEDVTQRYCNNHSHLAIISGVLMPLTCR